MKQLFLLMLLVFSIPNAQAEWGGFEDPFGVHKEFSKPKKKRPQDSGGSPSWGSSSSGCSGFILFKPECWATGGDQDWGGEIDPKDPRYKFEAQPKLERQPILETTSLPTTSALDFQAYDSVAQALKVAEAKKDRAQVKALSAQLKAMPKPNAVVRFNDDDMKNPNDWKVKYFDLVIVINKNARGQYLRAYKKPTKNTNALPELVKFGETTFPKVSTGRERAELSNLRRRVCNNDWNCASMAAKMRLSLEPDSHAPTISYFSQTTPGYYTPNWLNIGHVSGQYESSAMDHAVFFNQGIAMHKVPGGQSGRLGSRASGACVRLAPSVAQEIFWLVRGTGGPITSTEIRQGLPFWTQAGEISSRKSKSENARINRIWNCAANIDRNRKNGRADLRDEEECKTAMAQFLPPKINDCSVSGPAGGAPCEAANASAKAQFQALYDSLPATCYLSDSVRRDRIKQLKCLAEERTRILNKRVPVFSQEMPRFLTASWAPYANTQQVLVPKFDRFTGQPEIDPVTRSVKLEQGAYRTLVVVENVN